MSFTQLRRPPVARSQRRVLLQRPLLPSPRVVAPFISAIDPTKPVYGNPTTQSVRDNFAAAKAEIEALQAGQIADAPFDANTYGRHAGTWTSALALSGGTMTGVLTLAADPTVALSAATKQYADKMLPLSGGTLTGPLNYTATGGNTVRSAQDRAADVANVLELGADPTGATDSTTAIRNAVATQKTVYVPHGMYLVTDNIALNKGQKCYGDGRLQSMFRVNSASFNLAAAGVISMYQGEPSSQLIDIGIGFTQPDVSSRASLVQFPPAIFAQGAQRGKLIRIRIDGAYNGIDARGNTVLTMEDVENGSINIGMMWGSLNSGDGNGAKDYNHWGKLSFFPYGLGGTPNITNLYNDGTTIAAQIGEIDGLMCEGFSGYNCQLVLTTDSTNHTYGFSNLSLDGPGGIVDIQGGPLHLGITNLVLNTSTSSVPKLRVAGGNVMVGNGRFSSLGSDALIRVAGGFLVISAGYLYQASPSVMAAEVTGGQLVMAGMDFATAGTITAPFLRQTGGALAVSNCHFLAGGSGVGVQFTSDTAANKLIGLSLNGMTATLPASQTLGQYGSLPLTGGTLNPGPLTLGSNTGTGSELIINSGVSNRDVRFQTAGSSRWTLVCNATAEGGSNAGSDLVVNRYSDAGTFVDAPMTITRSTGLVTFASGITGVIGASTANIGTFAQVNVATTTGCNIRSGPGAPGSTQPAGSLYLRTDGAAGSRLYVSAGGGTWAAVAGV